MAADIGNLHRVQKSIGNQSLVRELVLTGREFPAGEAEKAGFVSRVHKDKDRYVSVSINAGHVTCFL